MAYSLVAFLLLFSTVSASRMLVNPITGRSVPVIVTEDKEPISPICTDDTRTVVQLKRFTRQLINETHVNAFRNLFSRGPNFQVNITIGEPDIEGMEELENRMGDRRIKNRIKSSIPKTDCELDTRTDLPKDNEPLYITKDGLAVVPQLKYNRSILAPFSGNLYLACIGEGNYLLTGGKQISEARCKGSDGYEIEGRTVNLKSVTCKSSNRAVVKVTNELCGTSNEGRIFNIGFEVGSTWHQMMSVCHNVEKAYTLYVDHVVNKLTSVGGIRENARGSFKEGHSTLFNGLRVNNLYKRANQKDAIKKILNREDIIDEKDKYLSRGHLAADADYIFSSHQQSTYFYINVAPQWYTVNAGNWLSVERKVKLIADKKKIDAVVRTGTQGILRQIDSAGYPKEIYLEPESKRIPVPAFFWKAVALGQEGIVFVTSNDPFNPPARVPCKDICATTGWRFERDVQAGRVFCCTFQDASRTILDIPQLKIQSILTWR